MRTFRFRSAGVAMALVAGSAVGAQITAVKPAVAQVPLFVVGPTTTDSYPINAGEKVPLGKILNVRSLDPNPVIIDIAAAASEGILINGVKAYGKSSSTGGDQITWDEDAWAFHFPTLQAALEANVTAYQGGRIAIRITARPAVAPDVRVAVGGSRVRFVELPGTPTPAIAIVPLASPPSIRAGEKVPLSKFVGLQTVFPIQQITSITFQASGGAQFNGASSGAIVPPALEVLLAAPVTASSDGGVTIFIAALATPPGQIVPQTYQSQGSILVKVVAPTTSAPTATPPTVPPTPPSIGAPPAGGGNRAPVAQSIQLVATTGAATPLALQASDPDANPLTYVLVQLPAHGKLSGQVPNLSYTPNSGFLGTDALIFSATDGTASSAQATVTITVTGKAVSTAKVVKKAVKKTVKKAVKKTVKKTVQKR